MMPNRFQHLIDAAEHQFGELEKEQIRGIFIWYDGDSCCYLGAYALEAQFDPMDYTSNIHRASKFGITPQEYDRITYENDRGESWQYINEMLEKGLP